MLTAAFLHSNHHTARSQTPMREEIGVYVPLHHSPLWLPPQRESLQRPTDLSLSSHSHRGNSGDAFGDSPQSSLIRNLKKREQEGENLISVLASNIEREEAYRQSQSQRLPQIHSHRERDLQAPDLDESLRVNGCTRDPCCICKLCWDCSSTYQK
jgi:hypothetical protein